MRGMILAAGRGQRMGQLTEHTPKPLLLFQGRHLIEYSIDSMIEVGIREIVINVSWHADQIQTVLGHGEKYGVQFYYSYEPEALETGGGIFNALPLLGESPFLVISSDIVIQQSLQHFIKHFERQAHILLVDNPDYHLKGDFSLDGRLVKPLGQSALTYGSVAVLSPGFFAACQPGRFPLGSLLRKAVDEGQVTGEHWTGPWWNIGTPELLNQVVIT